MWSTKRPSSRFTPSFSLTEVSPTLAKTLPSCLSDLQPSLLQVHVPRLCLSLHVGETWRTFLPLSGAVGPQDRALQVASPR